MNELNTIIAALEKITSHTETRFDWENLNIQMDDKRAEGLRQLCWQVADIFPGDGTYYSPEGMAILKAILDAIKREAG
jgi:hypothetical protein